MKELSAWNPAYWLRDPQTGYPSGRKLGGYVGALGLAYLTVTGKTIAIEAGLETLITMMSYAIGAMGIYAMGSPNKKNGNQLPPAP